MPCEPTRRQPSMSVGNGLSIFWWNANSCHGRSEQRTVQNAECRAGCDNRRAYIFVLVGEDVPLQTLHRLLAHVGLGEAEPGSVKKRTLTTGAAPRRENEPVPQRAHVLAAHVEHLADDNVLQRQSENQTSHTQSGRTVAGRSKSRPCARS